MDDDGRQQDMGHASMPASHAAEDEGSVAGGRTIADGSGPVRPEGRGQDRHGGGALATDRSDKAVNIQSVVDEDQYSGSAESGV